MDRGLPAGTPVSVNTGSERIEGRIAGLDAGGALLLNLPGGGNRRITFGDVQIGAPPGAWS